MAPSFLKSGAVSVLISLLGAVSAAGILLLLVFSSGLFSLPVVPLCTCPIAGGGTAGLSSPDPIGASRDDVEWLKSQLRVNSLQDSPETEDAWHELRKGINPRTRQQQLEDLRKYKGISHYEDDAETNNRTALPCPGELLVEEHHSNYGEPWAGGRDVFGLGWRDWRQISLFAINFFAVFLHMPDKLVWVGLERLAPKLKRSEGRMFVSHNIKFCSRLGGEECTRRLSNLGLVYVGKHRHDSLLFNHYEIWFEFRSSKV